MSIQAQRARYVPVERGFNIVRPSIEPQSFEQQRSRAFAADAPTGTVPLDLSPVPGTDYPATTPFMLARYVSVRARTHLSCAYRASGEIWVVLRGKGRVEREDETVVWCDGDILLLPGGATSKWIAEEDAVLWMVSDEPSLAFLGVRPEAPHHAAIETTLYRRDDIARELKSLYLRPMAPDTAGRALFMASARTERLGTCLPAMTLTLNAVRPGESQRPHRHNAAALVLALREARCASTIGGRTLPWTQYSTLLTPAGATHSHRNVLQPSIDARDDDIALSLIVQDGGLHYYGRTMDFSFV